jgi:hypothetical protein
MEKKKNKKRDLCTQEGMLTHEKGRKERGNENVKNGKLDTSGLFTGFATEVLGAAVALVFSNLAVDCIKTLVKGCKLIRIYMKNKKFVSKVFMFTSFTKHNLLVVALPGKILQA